MAAARPNFFIVGAPKCGTTALYEYLRPHPQIFLPRLKEPHFFAKDLGTYPAVKTPEAYAALFADATARHLRVGEASVYYLALVDGDSQHPRVQSRRQAHRHVPEPGRHGLLVPLAIALRVTGERPRLRDRLALARPAPARDWTCRAAPVAGFLLQYEDMGRFGTQARRLLATFPAAQVKIILFDDFSATPQLVYDEIIDFLELPHDGRAQFPRINENKRARMAWLRKLMVNPPYKARSAYRSFKQAVGGKHLDATKQWLIDRITVRERRPPLSPEFRAELVETFREEVALLSQLLNRDLSHWS